MLVKVPGSGSAGSGLRRRTDQHLDSKGGGVGFPRNLSWRNQYRVQITANQLSRFLPQIKIPKSSPCNPDLAFNGSAVCPLQWPLVSGESYLGILLCDIQVLELNLTKVGDGPPAPCLWICRAPLMRIRSRLRPETDYHCGMSFLQLLDLVAVPTDELGDLASVRACPQCLPAEWHTMSSCWVASTTGVLQRPRAIGSHWGVWSDTWQYAI